MRGLCRVCLLYFVNKAIYVSLQLRAKKKKDVSPVVYQTLQTRKIYFRKLLG